MNFWHGKGACGPCDPEWADGQADCLVQLYRLQPCLWNRRARSYLDYSSRRRAYERIHRGAPALGPTLVDVVLRIHELRRLYVDELRRRLEARASGGRFVSRYSWFDELHEFLGEHLTADEYDVIESSVARDKTDDCPSERTRRSREAANKCRSEPVPGPASPPARANVGPVTVNPCGLSEAGSDAVGSQLCSSTGLFGSSFSDSRSMRSRARREGSRLASSAGSSAASSEPCHRLDQFARSVARRLKQLEPAAAAAAERRIQRVLELAARDSEARIPDPPAPQPEEYCSCPAIPAYPDARQTEAALNGSPKITIVI